MTSSCFPHSEVSELADDVTSGRVWYDGIGCIICKLIRRCDVEFRFYSEQL
jgi:hypothetical protein